MTRAESSRAEDVHRESDSRSLPQDPQALADAHLKAAQRRISRGSKERGGHLHGDFFTHQVFVNMFRGFAPVGHGIDHEIGATHRVATGKHAFPTCLTGLRVHHD